MAQNGLRDGLQEPPIALQARSSRLTFREDSLDRSLSPGRSSWGFRSASSPSPGPSTHRSTSGTRATSKSRLLNGNGKSSSQSPGSSNGGRATSKARKAAADFKVDQDVRARLPALLQRFSGYRDPSTSAPYAPLPFPPFTWLARLPLQYETWILTTIGSFGGIALIEAVISAAFPNDGTILIVASFGASAVLCYGTIESPLAQPRHLVGGQVLSCILAVCLTRLFRLSSHYELSQTIVPGELNHIVWLNAALSMALSGLLMQITGTVHPPGGATAIIASAQGPAVLMSWRLIYVVLISSLLMLVWALIINNVGRRRYPHYWFSGKRTFVRTPSGEKKQETIDQEEMAAEEGRNNLFSLQQVPEDEREDQETEEGLRGRPSAVRQQR